MSSGKNHYARVQVTLKEKPGSGWTAEAGDVEADGGTQQDAVNAIAEMIADGTARAMDAPSFWLEDSGAILAAVPDVFYGGCEVYRITGDQAEHVESATGHPDGVYSSSYGLRRIQEKLGSEEERRRILR